MKLKYYKVKFTNMKAILILSIVSIVLLAGCTATVEQHKVEEKVEEPVENKEIPSLPKPQVTSTEGATQEAKITEGTTVQVTQGNASEPKTYNVNIVQGIGIREGAG